MRIFLRQFAAPLGMSLAFNAAASAVNAVVGHPFAQSTIGWWAVAFSVCASSMLGSARERAA